MNSRTTVTATLKRTMLTAPFVCSSMAALPKSAIDVKRGIFVIVDENEIKPKLDEVDLIVSSAAFGYFDTSQNDAVLVLSVLSLHRASTLSYGVSRIFLLVSMHRSLRA